MSTYLPLSLLGVAHAPNNPSVSFFVISHSTIASFSQTQGAFSVETQHLELEQLGRIICYTSHPQGFLTVHRKRQFCWWNSNFTHPSHFEGEEGAEVAQVIFIQDDLLGILDSQDL